MGNKEVQSQAPIRASGARIGSVGGKIEVVELDWPSEWFAGDGGIEYNPLVSGTAFDRRLARIAAIQDVNSAKEKGVTYSLEPGGSKVLDNAMGYLINRVPVMILERLQIINSLGGDVEAAKRAVVSEIENL